MKILALVLTALVRCTPAPSTEPPPNNPPIPIPVPAPVPDPAPVVTDAGTSSTAACKHLGTFPCRDWYPDNGGLQACVDGLNLLLASQTVTVSRSCLARVKSCAEVAGCSK